MHGSQGTDQRPHGTDYKPQAQGTEYIPQRTTLDHRAQRKGTENGTNRTEKWAQRKGYGERIFNCLIVGKCMSNCPMVGQCPMVRQ